MTGRWRGECLVVRWWKESGAPPLWRTSTCGSWFSRDPGWRWHRNQLLSQSPSSHLHLRCCSHLRQEGRNAVTLFHRLTFWPTVVCFWVCGACRLTWAGVRRHDDDAVFGCSQLAACFGDEVLLGARQACREKTHLSQVSITFHNLQNTPTIGKVKLAQLAK